ncbi:MAG TPA: hypothetical protein ENK38_05325 [Gammaproteobacteria bacterium]|nr:hypothetical protein [Gammaproteobacteria bacterium]
MRKRLRLKCWKCDKTFALTMDIAGQPLISKECPFCGARCTIDLNPYRQSTTEVLRGTEIDLQKETLHLPEEIPTANPDEGD